MEVIPAANKNIKKIAAALKNGAVFILPTDTVYGFICDAKNTKAVEKIFEIKKRNKKNPLAVFVKDIEMAKECAVISQGQEEVIEKAWPGDKTFILPAKPGLAKLIYKENTIGMRIPNYELIKEIINELNGPLAQTSANISGEPSATNVEEIRKKFDGEDIIFVDAGDLPKRSPSVIIDLTGDKEKILRP